METLAVRLPEEGGLVLSAGAAEKLIQSGSGDAALLYVALLQHRGGSADRVRSALGWTPERFTAALEILSGLGLAAAAPTAQESPRELSQPQESGSPDAGASTPVPRANVVSSESACGTSQPRRIDSPVSGPGTGPEYSRADMLRALEGKEFASLTAAVEEKLGKKLTTPDLSILLGLYDFVGLPQDVIYLLVNFCGERVSARYGPGRKPTLRQIEKEGYLWSRLGLFDQESASAYIKKYHRRQEAVPRLMALLRLGDRSPSPSEEKYLLSWSGMGFEDAALELAYDKTVLHCKELRWPYMNKILLSWHQKGLHTLREVQGDSPPSGRETGERKPPRSVERRKPESNPREDMARMEKYLKELRRQRGEGGSQ